MVEPFEFKINKPKEHFFDLLLGNTEQLTTFVFNNAQNSRNQGNFTESIQWYKLYTKLKDPDPDELYISFIELGVLYKILHFDSKKIESFFLIAKEMTPDRAEAYYHLGLFYNQMKNYQESYNILIKGIEIPINKNYKFINEYVYGKYLYDELSVACYWIEKYTEGMFYLSQIFHDPDFEACKERLLKNETFFKEKMSK